MAWFIIECTSTKEAASCEVLERLGYEETFYPQKKVDARPKGKRKRAVSKAPRWIYRAWVPGYVFVCTEAPQFHRINGSHGKLHLRVLAPGGVPYRVTDEDMARMADVPERLRAMIESARAAERAEREARRCRVGLPCQITGGALSGQRGPCVGQRPGEVQVEVGPLKVWVPEEHAEKVAA